MKKKYNIGGLLKFLELSDSKNKLLSAMKEYLPKDSIIISFVRRDNSSDRYSYDCIYGAKVKDVLKSLFLYYKMLPAKSLSLRKSQFIFQKTYSLNRLKMKTILGEKLIKDYLLFIRFRDKREDRIIIILSKEKMEPMRDEILEIVKYAFILSNLNEIERLYNNDIKMYSSYINNLEKKLHIINYIANSLMSTLSLKEIFNTLSHFISREIGFKMVLVNMLSSDNKMLERVAAAGISDDMFEQLKMTKIPIVNIEYLLKRKYKLSNYIYFIRNINMTEAAKYSAIIENNLSNIDEDRSIWRSEDTILIPIYDRTKKLIGTISLDGPVDGKIPDSKTLELLEIIAKFATLAVRNAFLYKKRSDTTEKLSKAYEITSFISKIMNVDDLVKNLTIMLRNNFAYLNVVILRKSGNTLEVFYASDYNEKEIGMINEMLKTTNSSVTKRSWLDGRSYLIKDSSKVTDFITIRNKVVSEIAIPIVVHNQKWGVLNVEKEGAKSLDEEDLKLLEIIVHHLSSAIENAHLYKELNIMANTDPMTGLYNYRYLKNYLTELIGKDRNHKTVFSLVMLDMNDFKKINDSYGHLAGDEVLKWLSSKLISSLGDFSKVTRYGGDEFFIIMEKNKEEANLIIKRFRDEIRAVQFEYNGNKINVDFSIGIKEFPTDEGEMFKLIDKVDKDLYRDKKRIK